MTVREAVGAYGERVAVRALEDAGYAILDRNWRSRAGELDVVAMRGGVVVFVEVKCRRTASYGPPSLALMPTKITHLRAAAVAWLAAHCLEDAAVRFDVISVLRPFTGPALVEHVEGAF